MKENVESLQFQTMQLFIVLAAIVAVAWLVMRYLTRQGAGTDKKCNIHVYYLVGIGSLLLLGWDRVSAFDRVGHLHTD